MILNFNIGLLGHVDSGKTSLAKALSSVASTAAFDKDPQSQSRGITLDLGFSATSMKTSVPAHLLTLEPDLKEVRLTFVDCPGHASLIKTAIGGAQIIDLMLLVVDAQKGMQTQTAECLVIAEMLQRKMIVVLNKIDMLTEQELSKVEAKLRKTFANTSFGSNVPILKVSAVKHINLDMLMAKISDSIYMPERHTDLPFVMYVDHCFLIKGQGTILTGTVMQGCLNINDTIELPMLHLDKKVKQIQMHHESIQRAVMGDRIGVCVTQLPAEQVERSVACQPGYLRPVYAVCIELQRIAYYKNAIKSRSKLHITIAHDTVMGNITLLRPTTNNGKGRFDRETDYEYIDELEEQEEDDMPHSYLALVEFDRGVFVMPNGIIIASKLDVDTAFKGCRLAFWGKIMWSTQDSNYAQELYNYRLFKRKEKQGYVQRFINTQNIIIDGLFKKLSDRTAFVGMRVNLASGEQGIIDSTFGKSSKMKVYFANGVNLEMSAPNTKVSLYYKKHIFNKDLKYVQ